MVNFRNICGSIASLITPKSPSSDQRPLGHTVKTPNRQLKEQKHDSSMNSFLKAKAWFSRQTRGGEVNTNSLLSNTSKSRKRQRSISTSPSLRKKRVIDENYATPVDHNDGEDFEGPTLIDDEGNNGFKGESEPDYASRSETQETQHSAYTDMDGDTVMDFAQTSESGDIGRKVENQSNMGNMADDENSAGGDSDCDLAESLSYGDYDEQPHAAADFIEEPKLSRKFKGLESDDEYVASGTSSEGDDSDEIMTSPPARRRPRKRRPKRAHPNNDAYRPSPDIVDKDLTSDIVSIHREEAELSEEEILKDEVAVKKSDKKEVAYDQSRGNTTKSASSIKLPGGHWSCAETDLYLRLAMRGYEPIIQSNWRIDFETLPNTLFVAPGGPEPYIHPIHETEFRAIKFLNDLFYIGNRVRDRALAGFRPEPVIGYHVRNYIKWALKDANLHNRPNSIPLYAMYAMRGSRNSRRAFETINRRLVTLANRYREALRLRPNVEDVSGLTVSDENAPKQCYLDRKFPVITGFLICGPTVSVLTVNSDPAVNPDLPPDTAGKFISQFDFSRGGQDVWNALAIAISVVRVRKNILELIDDCPDDPMWTIGNKIDAVDPDL